MNYKSWLGDNSCSKGLLQKYTAFQNCAKNNNGRVADVCSRATKYEFSFLGVQISVPCIMLACANATN